MCQLDRTSQIIIPLGGLLNDLALRARCIKLPPTGMIIWDVSDQLTYIIILLPNNAQKISVPMQRELICIIDVANSDGGHYSGSYVC